MGLFAAAQNPDATLRRPPKFRCSFNLYAQNSDVTLIRTPENPDAVVLHFAG